MSFSVDKKDKYAHIKTSVEKLDSNVAPSLKSELVVLNAEGVKNILLDLEKTRYCDSSGLSAILVANRLCKNSNGALVITGLNESVKKLITISQLDSILKIGATAEECLALFSNAELARKSTEN
jgi:anti-anti-sigma factor